MTNNHSWHVSSQWLWNAEESRPMLGASAVCTVCGEYRGTYDTENGAEDLRYDGDCVRPMPPAVQAIVDAVTKAENQGS